MCQLRRTNLRTSQTHAWCGTWQLANLAQVVAHQNQITLRSAHADAIKGNFCGIFVFQVPNFQKFRLRRAKQGWSSQARATERAQAGGSAKHKGGGKHRGAEGAQAHARSSTGCDRAKHELTQGAKTCGGVCMHVCRACTHTGTCARRYLIQQ